MSRATHTIGAAIVLSGALTAIWAGQAMGQVNPNGTNVYKGEVAGGGKVYFEAKFKNGEPTKMGYALALAVPVDCVEGNAKASFANESLPLRIPVRKRGFKLFSGEIRETTPGFVSVPHPFTGSFAGRLDKDGKHASGTLDFSPVDLSDTDHGCSTGGSRTWTAKLSRKFAPHG